MKKLILSALAIASIGLYSATAQLNVTITSPDFAQASSTTNLVMLVDTTPSITIGTAGTAKSWDFTSLVPMMIDTNKFTPTSGAGFDADFPNANQKWENSQLTTYIDNSNDKIELAGILGQEMELLGFPIDLGAVTAFNFDDPMTFVEFPSSYGDTFIDTSRFMYSMDGSFVPQVTIDSVRLKHTSYMHSNFDAEGILTNPGDTAYDVIRQKRIEYRRDTIEVYVTDAITALFLNVPIGQWSYFQYQGFDNPVLDTMYTYSWYANNQDFPVVSVEVDENDAPIRASWLYANNLMALVDATVNTACPAAANGEAIITLIGGASPYTYDWDNGETTLNASALTSGVHTMTVSDNMSASFIVSVTVEADPDYNVSLATTPISCSGCNDASITISGMGGTAPYTYAWSNGVTTGTITGLASSTTYSLTVTDTYGCQATASSYVTGIENREFTNVNIYPNPVRSGVLNISTPEQVQIIIYNMIGERMITDNVIGNSSIQLNDFASGVYLIQISSEKGITTRKITIE